MTTNQARSEDFSPQTRTVYIKLTQFLTSLAEVPTKELEAIKERAIKSGLDFIDFWAVDFNWHLSKPSSGGRSPLSLLRLVQRLCL